LLKSNQSESIKSFILIILKTCYISSIVFAIDPVSTANKHLV